MSACVDCGSWAINHHLYGRDGSRPDLCDTCYWRLKAEKFRRDAERYRWLRDLPLGSKHEQIGNMPGDMWDAAIDAAMGEREGAT